MTIGTTSMGVSLKLCLYLLISVSMCLNATILANSVSSQRPLCLDHEKSALLQFKHSFRIDCSVSLDELGVHTPIAKMKSWIDGPNEDCCSWEGVECSKDTGHVIGLNLTCSCISGTFPPNSTLFSLAHLQNLMLNFNDFNYSQIPSKIGQLHKLQVLDLFDSSFTGRIPAEISDLTELIALDIGDYKIVGNPKLNLQGYSLEKLVKNLTRLQQLEIYNVDLSSNVPLILTNLTSLRVIVLSFGNLYGEFPSDIFRLPHLEILEVLGNRDLYGSLPDEFQHHSPLEQIYFRHTSLSGEVPPSIARLTRLEIFGINSNQFSGSIPSSLGNLTQLRQLDLRSNSFNGVIPTSISNLTNLQVLLLSDLTVRPGNFVSQLNMLGKVEQLGLSGMSLGNQHPSFLANLTRLTYLDLINSQGRGPVPNWLASLKQLTSLSLSKSNLDGPIPPWFSNLTNLQNLDLSFNNLSGSFEIFSNLKYLEGLDLLGLSIEYPANYMTNSSLRNLRALRLASCNLTEFPAFLRNQNELQILDLSHNQIRGSIPQWFVNLTRGSLLVLDLSANNLTGFEQRIAVLPWTHLREFDISSNSFRGPLLPLSPYFESYDVSNNHFSGPIPKQFCIARSLLKLDLSDNNLSGEIPHCIGNHLGESLQLLNLRGNNLHGHIPCTFTTSCKIKMINLSGNQLEGTLPRSMSNCTQLQVLDIGRNCLKDTFPSWLGSMPKLQVLVLRDNSFHGSISDKNHELCFQNLQIIDLSKNFLTGHLPTGCLTKWQKMMVSEEDQFDSSHTSITYYYSVSEATTESYEYSITITNKGTERLYPKILDILRVIDFSSNKFSGKIPEIVGALKGLQALNLSNNNLEGKIPPSLANLSDLESLDLSQNMLSGAIPSGLSQLISLEVFDVYHNHLSGPIPKGNQFNTFDNGSYKGNLGLCGSPLSKECGKADTMESPTTSDESKEESEWIDWIIRSSGCLGGFVVGYIIGKLYITDGHHEWFIETFQKKPKKRVRRPLRQRR